MTLMPLTPTPPCRARAPYCRGQEVDVKVLDVVLSEDRKPARITFSLKQLQADPLLETLDTIMPVRPEPRAIYPKPETQNPEPDTQQTRHPTNPTP